MKIPLYNNINLKVKPLSKSSKINRRFKRVGGWCEPIVEIFPNGLVRADRTGTRGLSTGPADIEASMEASNALADIEVRVEASSALADIKVSMEASRVKYEAELISM